MAQPWDTTMREYPSSISRGLRYPIETGIKRARCAISFHMIAHLYPTRQPFRGERRYFSCTEKVFAPPLPDRPETGPERSGGQENSLIHDPSPKGKVMPRVLRRVAPSVRRDSRKGTRPRGSATAGGRCPLSRQYRSAQRPRRSASAAPGRSAGWAASPAQRLH